MEKSDKHDTWSFKVPAGDCVLKKLTREHANEPGIKYSYSFRSKFKFDL